MMYCRLGAGMPVEIVSRLGSSRKMIPGRRQGASKALPPRVSSTHSTSNVPEECDWPLESVYVGLCIRIGRVHPSDSWLRSGILAVGAEPRASLSTMLVAAQARNQRVRAPSARL